LRNKIITKILEGPATSFFSHLTLKKQAEGSEISIKVKLSQCLIKYHAMKMYGRVEV
jgi:hypothetical protein